jgi:hypothetical protein
MVDRPQDDDLGAPGRTTEVSVIKRILETLSGVCLATSMAWAAQSPFIGEWKLDPSKTRMPDEMKVQSQGANKYAFDFGGGVETIVVDGSDQPGCCGTLLSVKPEAADTWIVERKKDGRLLLRATWKLSKDGSTLTDYYREFDSQPGLRLPALGWRIGLRGGLAEHQGDHELALFDRGEGV